jgi:aspartate/methionine/tyrosine aminotransferase
MQYRRLPIEIESPENYGYGDIDCNLSESSFTDQRLGDLGLDLSNLLLSYNDHKGKLAFREIIAAEANVTEEDVLVTPGAAAALFIVATSLIEKGEHVLVAKTNYATNIETPRAIGANLSFLTLDFDKNFELDLQQLENSITPQTKLVSLTYPHNPTGAIIDLETLKKIVEIIERKQILLLLDETYRDMNFREPIPVAAGLSERIISISSMSKSYGLPGIRIGWIICQNPSLMQAFLAAKEQIIITNSVVDEEIAYQYIARKQELFAPVKATIFNNFLIVRSFMQQQNLLEWIEPKGGCVCFPRIKKTVAVDTERFHKTLLEKYSTYVGGGHWFEEDDRYMRIGYSWDKKEKLEKGLSNILKAIEESRI